MKARTTLALAIACVPTKRLRGWLYGLLPGYAIERSSRIGWLSLIDVQSLSMAAGSSVGRGCRIAGPMHFELGVDAVLGGRNHVGCGRWYARYDSPDAPYAREFILEADAKVGNGHYFDATGGIRIGEGSWIAGSGSQFWTHGLGAVDRSVVVGRLIHRLSGAVRSRRSRGFLGCG